MAFELYYTSAPEGLKRGTSGFSTVNATEGISKALWDRLESLSAYRHHFSAGTQGGGASAAAGGTGENPVSYAHWLLTVGGATHHVLSRICDAGLDHTQRTNAFAHHLVLDSAELAAAGPAWLLQQANIMATRWNGQVGDLPKRTDLPKAADPQNNEPAICHAWAAVTGDAGWAGYLADVVAKTPTKPVCVLFNPDQDPLPLIAEAIALLPPSARWNVTFNTYFTGMPTSATCSWRCCLAHTPAAQTGLRYAANGIVIDLTDRAKLAKGPPATPGSKFVDIARNGPPPPPPPPPPKPAPSTGTTAAGKNSSPGRDSLSNGRSRPASSSDGPPSKNPNRPAANGPRGFGGASSNPPTWDREDEETIPLLPNDDSTGDSLYDVAPGTQSPKLVPRPPPRVPAIGMNAPVRSGRLGKSAEVVWDQQRKLKPAAAPSPQKRRQQILLIFGCAVAALGVCMGLVYMANNRGGPTLPDQSALIPAPRPLPHSTPTAPPPSDMPDETASQTPTPPSSPSLTPTTVHLPAQSATPVRTAPPAPRKPTFPATILLTSLQRPTSQGIGDFVQNFPFPSNVLNPAMNVTSIALRFPGDTDGTPDNRYPYNSALAGTFISTPSTTSPVASLAWRPNGSLADQDIATVTFDKARSQITLDWKAGMLVRHPDVARLAYWVVAGSQVELRSFAGAKSTGQSFTFPTFSLSLPLGAGAGDIPWPSDPPVDASLVASGIPAADKMVSSHGAEPLKALPEGWKASWYTDWVDKDATLRTPDRAAQVVKFEKATATPAVSAWFSVRTAPGLKHVESTFDQRLAEQKTSLDQTQQELKGLADQLQHVKDVNYGTIPEDDNTKSIRKHQDEDKQLIAAYQEAIQDYQNCTDIDVAVVLPNGLRVATLQFHQTPSK